MNRAAVGRADLIRWADRLGDARLVRLAGTLDLAEVPPPADAPPAPGTGELPAATGADASVPADRPAPERCEFALTQRELLAPLPESIEPAILPTADEAVAPLPPPPPLLPWARLWPFLHTALSIEAERHRIDQGRLVAAAANLRPLRRLPRLRGRRWAPRAQVLLDLSRRLYPFWDDFHDLHGQLARLRGVAGLEVLRLDAGPAGPVQPWQGQGWGAPRAYAPPPDGVPVLILGDLGGLGPGPQRDAWEALGRQLARRQSRPVVLTPVPPRWWDPALAGLCFPVTLARDARLPPRPAGPRPWPAAALDPATLRDDPGARLLLTLLSASIAITPALLRHLRHRLPAGLADVGSEAAAWQHPAFAGGDQPLVPADSEAVAALRRAFAATGTPGQRALAWGLIRAQQAATGVSRAVCMEERALYAAMRGGADAEAEAFLERAAAVFTDADDTANLRQLRAWVDRRAARAQPEVFTLSPATNRLWLLAHPEAATAGAVHPPGFDIHRALAGLGLRTRLRSWRLVQRGAWLEWEPDQAPTAACASGSPVLAAAPTRQPVIAVCPLDRAGPVLSLGLDRAAGGAGALPLGTAGWSLRSDFEQFTIEPLARPAWAHTLGRDGEGLFVGFADPATGAERRAYWVTAGQGWGNWPGWLGGPRPLRAGAATSAQGCEQGRFLDATQFRLLRDQGLAATLPAGARLAIDQYGIRAEIDIEGVPLVLRWLWPGGFLMGSPATEAGRDDDETQHPVTLTRGFWLAETACTQALWQAVMGKNPSYQQDPQRPVEKVSWNDVQGFIDRLAALRLAPAWGFRLPTEAEWEYACRAGTTSAYWFGDTFDETQVNDGGETVPVRSLPANPWGLYEVHGNVWEWCQDRFGDYAADAQVDPAGLGSGGGRVVRGGGWINLAGDCRSAQRLAWPPGYRRDDQGFRLARGPEPGWSGRQAG